MDSNPLLQQIETALTGMFANHRFTVNRQGIRYTNCTRQGLIKFPQGIAVESQDYRWWAHRAAEIVRSRQ